MIIKMKSIVYFQIFIVVLSIFSFSYIIKESTRINEKNYLFDFLSILINEFKEPIIPIVSASDMVGCCSRTEDGQICSEVLQSNCNLDADFLPGRTCLSAPFCKEGCCYIEDEGVYDPAVIQGDCEYDWAPDRSCNLPGAIKGCCVLGENTRFETYGECKFHSDIYALSKDSEIDWKEGLSQIDCLLLAQKKKKGACVLPRDDCKFTTEANCVGLDGVFHEDILCTSSDIQTNCRMTEKTRCVDGFDGVYFVDSCGNTANIYDAKRAKDPTYWDRLISTSNSCSAPNGARDSKTCGNCNRFEGGICSPAKPDNFDVQMGDYYCRNTECTYKDSFGQTHKYKNGESWCVYDGPIGDGEDVPGSRHFRYICNAGTVKVEPCADLRNEICVQRNTMDTQGSAVTDNVNFHNAVCRKNNAKHCIQIGEGSMKACEQEPDCMVLAVTKAVGSFDFEICVPMYPEGFSFEPKYQAEGSNICAINTRTCVTTYVQMIGCPILDNGGCLGGGHFGQMDEICKALGDCKGTKTIPNYYQTNPIRGQVAGYDSRIEKYLRAAGLSHGDYLGVGSALFDNSAFAGAMFAKELDSTRGQVPQAKEIPDSGKIGGMIAALGGLLAGLGGILGSTLLSIAGMAMTALGGILSALSAAAVCPPTFTDYNCRLWEPPRGLDCDVCNHDEDIPCTEYRCGSLGTTCELINKGTTNEICVRGIDDGRFPIVTKVLSIEEIIAAENLYDRPDILEFVQNVKFREISEDYFEITNVNGGCVDAYSAVPIVFNTQVPAKCKYDFKWEGEGFKDFEDMENFVGNEYYDYNHSSFFILPDPSDGESLGLDIQKDMTVYIKCISKHDHQMPEYLVFDFCVNEGDDLTAPLLSQYPTPRNGSYVSFDQESFDFMINIRNGPATCKWDYDGSLSYDSMGFTFDLCDGAYTRGIPKCTTKLPINRTLGATENNFFIRCKDQPWLNGTDDEINRNANTESYYFVYYRPEKKISIDSIKPIGEILINTEQTTINFEVETSGGGTNHTCLSSFDVPDEPFELLNTGKRGSHSDEFSLFPRKHTIYVQCFDETQDSVNGETSFNIVRSNSISLISRAWQSEDKFEKKLYFVSESEVSCVYSEENCRFNYESGIPIDSEKNLLHKINYQKGKTYFVKCKDELGNMPNACSIILSPL
jgi:hypothetical protein